MIDAAEGDATQLSGNSLVQTYKAIGCFGGGGAQNILFILKINWTVAA